MPVSRRLWAIALTYDLAVGLVGCAAMISLASTNELSLPLYPLLLFVLLSVCVKRLGFRVAPQVTHSLVGIVDLAALFGLGALGGAIVAATSSLTCQIGHYLHERPAYVGPHHSAWFGPSILFGTGLNISMVWAARWVYGSLGGGIPLSEPAWPQVWPALAACGTWFTLDHVGWSLYIRLHQGRQGLSAFIREIIPFSLITELVPLPISILITAAYLSPAPVLFDLAILTIIGFGLLMRRLAVSLANAQRHVRDLFLTSSLGQDLLRSHLDLMQTCALIYQYCAQIVDVSQFAFQIADKNGALEPDGIRVPLLMIDSRPQEPSERKIGLGAFRWLEAVQRPIVADFDTDMPFSPLQLGRAVHSGLYVPIVLPASGSTKRKVLGVISLQSADRSAYTAEDRRTLDMIATQAALGLHTASLYEREQGRSAQLMAIAEVSRKVAAILDLQTLFSDTVQLVQKTFGYYCVSLLLTDHDQRKITFAASSDPIIQEKKLDVRWGRGLIGHVAESGHSLLVNNVALDARYIQNEGLGDTRAELIVPLRVEQRIVGLLDVQSDHVDAFTEEDLFILQTLSDQIAIAIEDSRLYDAQQRQAWVSTALLQVADAVSERKNPDEILETVVRLTIMLTGIETCAIFLWSGEDGGFRAVETMGFTQDQRNSLDHQVFAEGASPLLDDVRMSGTHRIAPCAELRDFLPPPFSEYPPNGQLMALPLIAKSEVLGVLVAEEHDANEDFTEHRQAMLRGIANQAAMALENARLIEAQREEAWVSTALLQVANMISTQMEPEASIATVVRLAPLLVGVRWCAVLLWDSKQEAFVGTAAHGLPQSLTSNYRERLLFPDNVPLLKRIAEERQTLTLTGPNAQGLLPSDLSDELALGTLTAVPLVAGERLHGVLVAGHPRSGDLNSSRRENILIGIANQTSLALEAAYLRKQALSQERLEHEMALAREIQTSFLPECCPDIAGWEFAIEWRAARGVGGDYYDFVPLDEYHLGLVIADVSDKGVAAALYMALSRTVMRVVATSSAHPLDPAQTLVRVNKILMEDSRAGMFVSLFYGILDLRDGQFRYARAGHNPPYLVRAATGEIQALESPGIVLGILEDPQFANASLTMAAGDAIVMYTDGVTEAIDEENAEFGEERLQQVISVAPQQGATTLVNLINTAVSSFTGNKPQFDDFTLLVCKRQSDQA